MALPNELTSARNERFLALLKPVYRDCERWALSLTKDRDQAEEVLAQSVLTGLQSIHQLKNDGAFKHWMFKVIRTAFQQILRQQKRLPESVDPEQLDWHAPRDDAWTLRSERADTLKQVLEHLPPEQRQALVLFEVYDFSIREISAVLDKKEPAVRVMLHRARLRLAELLRQAGIEPGS